MLLKYLDVLAASGQLDSAGAEEDTAVSLIELKGFETGKKNAVAVWAECGVVDLSHGLLFYTDTDDGSNAMIGSWQRFYCGKRPLSDSTAAPFFGGSGLMGKGFPKWGGVAKAAIYLRYSDGFLAWLETKDAKSAALIRKEHESFRKLFVDPKKANLPAVWTEKLKPSTKWPLPVVCRLANGRAVILGLNPRWTPGPKEAASLDTGEIALDESLELARLFRPPPKRSREIITGELHASNGMGRNAFGFNPKIEEMSSSEYIRLLGPEPVSSRAQVLQAWNQCPRYPVRVAPNPDGTGLRFLPEGDLTYETLRLIIAHEGEKRDRFFAALKSRKAKGALKDKTEEPDIIAEAPNYLPRVHFATVFLVNLEGSQKKKLNVLAIFPSVNLAYWQLLNTEFMECYLEPAVTNFCRAAITGHEKGSGSEHAPSVYNYWTSLFTAALQHQFVSVLPAWNLFQRYCKAFGGAELTGTDKPKARAYLALLAKLRRLQHIVGRCRAGPPDVNAIRDELVRVENVELVKYGVLDPMNTTPPVSAAACLGETYNLLRETQCRKIDEFVRQSWQGAPEVSYPAFIRGALVGMLLSELSWLVNKEGRRFEATQGRHPTTLRGEIIPAVFTKGIGLLMNLGAAQKFNNRLMPFILQSVPESRTDAFNSGLIMGMVYLPPKAVETAKEDTASN